MTHNRDSVNVVENEAQLDVVKYSSLKYARCWGVWSSALSSVIFSSPCWSDCAYTVACAPRGVEKTLSIVRFDVCPLYLDEVGASSPLKNINLKKEYTKNGAKR